MLVVGFFFIPVYDLNLSRKFLSRFIFHWCDCRRRNFKKARSSFRSYCTEYHSNHIVFISSSNIRSQRTICAWKHSNNSSYSLATVGSLESLRLVKIRDRNQFLLILLFEQTLSALIWNFFSAKVCLSFECFKQAPIYLIHTIIACNWDIKIRFYWQNILQLNNKSLSPFSLRIEVSTINGLTAT